MNKSYEITKEEYEVKWKDNLPQSYYDADLGEVWEVYHSNLYPYLDLISDEMKKVDKPTEEQIMLAFFVKADYWRVIKKTFTGINQALNGKRIGMRLKAQIDLLKGVELSPSSGKLIETQLIRYDNEFKPKGQEVPQELPKTIQVNIVDMSLDDKERVDKAHIENE